MTTQPLAEHARVSDPRITPGVSLEDEKQPVNRVLLWGFILMFIGVTIGIIGKKLLHDDIVTVVGALVSVAGMFLAAYPYVSQSAPKKYASRPTSQPEALRQAQPAKYLPEVSNTEYVASITERTTDLLKSSVATTPKKEDGESQG